MDLNIIEALEALRPVISTLKHMRGDHESIANEIKAAIIFGNRHGIDGEAEFNRHHRQRAMPRRIDDRPESTVELNFATFYCKEFFQVLDVQTVALEDNLKVAFEIIKPAVSILMPPYSNDEANQQMINALAQLFPAISKPDEESLMLQLGILKRHFMENRKDIQGITAITEYSAELKYLFPLTAKYMQLLLTAPITAASTERSFSKLIKTLMRSTMKQGRLKHTMKLACEKDLTDSIDLEEVIKLWAKLPKTKCITSIGPAT